LKRKRIIRFLAAGGVASVVATFGPFATGQVAGADARSVTPVSVVHAGAPLQRLVVSGSGTAASVASLDEAVLTDIAAAAKGSGQSSEALAEREVVRKPFRALVTQLSEDYPDQYLSSGFVKPGDGTPADAWITLSSRPSNDLVAEIKNLPLIVEVRFGIAGGVKALLALQTAATDLVGNQVTTADPSGRVESHVDDETGAIEINYQSDVELSPSKIESLIEAARSQSGSDDGSVVSVARTDVVKAEGQTVVHGGYLMRVTAGAYNYTCTTGFTAKIPGGSSGVVTADHCRNDMRYNHTAGIVVIEIDGPTNVDMQFHKTISANGHSTDSQFYTHSGWRTLTSKTTPSSGDPVCVYGVASQNSGSNCTTNIDTVNHCLTYSGELYCGLVYMDDGVTEAGDSGGPWHWGTSAYGTHSGLATIGCCTDFSFFTSINFVNTQLGLDLKYN